MNFYQKRRMTAKPGTGKRSGSSRSRDAGDKDRLIAELKDQITVLTNKLHLRSKDVTFRNVVEPCEAEDARSRLAAIVSSCSDAVISKTLNGTITSWNKGAEQIYGYSEAEAVGQTIGVIVPTDRMQELEEILDKVRRGERVERYETVRVTKDGRMIDVSVTISPILDASGNAIGASTIARDITGRKRDEKERDVMVEFLSLVNEAQSTRELVRRTATFFQQKSDCEAIGIRLPEGNDYPYYEARGFTPDFIRKENRLCTRDEQGRVLRDKDGFPRLECMCGNIITGRFDPSKPFFTARGSFWTNSTTELLATATEKDLLTKTRNVCIYEGYESMALIPLRVGAERLGVLQLNDRRKGHFTPEQIAMWERLANYLAVALARFRAADVIRSSESKFRTLLENAGAAIFIADRATGEILDCNAKAESLTGRPRNEIIGQHQTMLHPPDQAEAHSEMFARHAIADVTTDYEAMVQRKDGRAIPVMINAAPVTVNGRDVMIGFFIDITERKLAEEQLKNARFILERSLKFTEALLSAIPIPVFYKDRNGRYLGCNRAFSEMMGVTEHQLRGKAVEELWPGEYSDVYRRKDNELLESAMPQVYEFKVRDKDGVDHPVIYSKDIFRDENGQVAGIVGTFTDITERKWAEEALRESEGKFRVLSETSPAAIFLYQGEKYVYVNPMAETLTGYSREELLTGDAWEWIHPEFKELVKGRARRRQLREPVPTRYEVKYRAKDGREGWVDFTAGLIEYGGKPAGLAMAFDVSKRKLAEEALKSEKMQAELYVDLMCHDISNMNQVGLGFLEMALDMLDLDEASREMLLKPKSAFDNSSKLINNVRKLKKAKSGEYSDREIDIGQVLRKLQDNYSKQYGSRISINYLMNVGYIIKANDLLYDLFSNLVENAIKHSRGHPIIDINVEPIREDGCDYYKVRIDDQGPGIPDELKAIIFERKLTGDTKSKGSGIGLFLVKTLVDSYGGRVWVEDRVKGDRTKGARFVVLLPAVEK